jgi:hypothetical protein
LPVAGCLCSHPCSCRHLFAPLLGHIQARTHHTPQSRSSRHGREHGHVHAPPTARSVWPVWPTCVAADASPARPQVVIGPSASTRARGSVLGAFVAGLGAFMVFVRCRTVFYGVLRCFTVFYGVVRCFTVFYGVLSVCRSVCRTVFVRSRVRTRRTVHPPLDRRRVYDSMSTVHQMVALSDLVVSYFRK